MIVATYLMFQNGKQRWGWGFQQPYWHGREGQQLLRIGEDSKDCCEAVGQTVGVHQKGNLPSPAKLHHLLGNHQYRPWQERPTSNLHNARRQNIEAS